MRAVEAQYEGGMLKLMKPLALRPGERVGLIVVRIPDARRWDPDLLAKVGLGDEDAALANAGMSEWANDLDDEDKR